MGNGGKLGRLTQPLGLFPGNACQRGPGVGRVRGVKVKVTFCKVKVTLLWPDGDEPMEKVGAGGCEV